MGKLKRMPLSLDTLKLAWGITPKISHSKEHRAELKTAEKLATASKNQLKKRLKKSR